MLPSPLSDKSVVVVACANHQIKLNGFSMEMLGALFIFIPSRCHYRRHQYSC